MTGSLRMPHSARCRATHEDRQRNQNGSRWDPGWARPATAPTETPPPPQAPACGSMPHSASSSAMRRARSAQRVATGSKGGAPNTARIDGGDGARACLPRLAATPSAPARASRSIASPASAPPARAAAGHGASLRTRHSHASAPLPPNTARYPPPQVMRMCMRVAMFRAHGHACRAAARRGGRAWFPSATKGPSLLQELVVRATTLDRGPSPRQSRRPRAHRRHVSKPRRLPAPPHADGARLGRRWGCEGRRERATRRRNAR